MSFNERFSDRIEKMNEVTDFSRKHDMVKLTKKEWDFSCLIYLYLLYAYKDGTITMKTPYDKQMLQSNQFWISLFQNS